MNVAREPMAVTDVEVISNSFETTMEAPLDASADADYFVPAEDDMMFEEPAIGEYYDEDAFLAYDNYGDASMDLSMETQAPKDPILSKIPFVAGTIGAALLLGIVLGILLGKKRVRKGFDLYED